MGSIYSHLDSELGPFSIGSRICFLLTSPLVSLDAHGFKLCHGGLLVELLRELVYCRLEAFAVLGHLDHGVDLSSE